MNKQEELKKPIVVLNEVYGKDPRNTDVCYPLSTILKAMEEYADQFKKQLKEKEEQLTKSNEMNERLAEALFEVKFDNIQYGGITGVVKDKMNEALTEYQNSKK